MSTAGSVLATRLYAALRVTGVAAAAGVDLGTWSSATVPRVFRGLNGLIDGRSRGRLPLVEFEQSGPGQDFQVRNNDGGDLESQVTIRAHVGGCDHDTAANLSEAILTAALVAIRDQSSNNYLKMGTQRIEPMVPGPWGHMRDAVVTVSHSWSATSFEQA